WITYLRERGELGRKTVEEYRKHIARLFPYIGHKALDRLTALDFDEAYSALLKQPSQKGGTLKPVTINNAHRAACSALNDAVRWRLISENPIREAEAPSRGKIKAKGPTPAQFEAFLAKAEGTEWWLLLFTAALTGLRRGELLGLRWSDVNLEARTIMIS